MKIVAYRSPFVPPEWIAAHAVRPSWLPLRHVEGQVLAGLGRGVCPFAGAVIDTLLSGVDASAAVLTTACDQMRYAASLCGSRGQIAVFLMNVPSTWRTPTARQIYVDELRRLGRFLVRLGGTAPSEDFLAGVVLDYDRRRRELRAAETRLSPRRFAESVAELRSGGGPLPGARSPARSPNGVPLALVGGPLMQEDYVIFDLIEQAGGHVALDATESGQRTLAAPLDPQRTRHDPLNELAEAYFGSIPDVFRRPNDAMHRWLRRHLDDCGVRGIVFRRFLWCDLWHAELHRLKQWSPVPVLQLDVADSDAVSPTRTLGRLEAFLETLR